MNITLTGFMGCGKSSVGRVLSDRLPEYDFIDLDDFIEEGAGKSIPEIFSEKGEEAFRKMEEDALEILFMSGSDSGLDRIVSLGGGTVTNPESAKLIKDNSVCFYLRATIETLVENLEADNQNRPMLQGGKDLKERIEELMESRAGIYESVASYTIDTDGMTYGQIADLILETLENGC